MDEQAEYSVLSKAAYDFLHGGEVPWHNQSCKSMDWVTTASMEHFRTTTLW